MPATGLRHGTRRVSQTRQRPTRRDGKSGASSPSVRYELHARVMCPEPVDRHVNEPVLGGAGPLGTCSKSLPRRGRYGWSEPGRELREVARSGGAGAAPAGVGRDGYGRGRPIPTGARGGFRARHTPVAGEAWETRSPRSAVLTEFGHLLDTFVVGEVLKQASSRGDPRSNVDFPTEPGPCNASTGPSRSRSPSTPPRQRLPARPEPSNQRSYSSNWRATIQAN